ncbi:hypothetical protein RhiTH_011003 [Rhizoctonia solani]
MHGAYLKDIANIADQPSNTNQVEICLEAKGGRALEDDKDDNNWDAWYNKEDNNIDKQAELANARVKVKPLVGFKELQQQGQYKGQPWEMKELPLGAGVNNNSPTFYPNPQHVLAKTPTRTATASYIVRKHGTERFLHCVNLFLAKEVPQFNEIRFYNNSIFNIWSRTCLFHLPPLFQPSKELQMDVVWAQPAKINQYDCTSCPCCFDTILLLAYPKRAGIHCY